MLACSVPFSVRCRYCRHLLATDAQLGEREALAVRAHLATCYPNVGALPHTIGELLRHLNVSIAAHDTAIAAAAEDARERAFVASHRAVLVVVADAGARAALSMQLAGSGYGIATAGDAVDALRHLYGGFEPCAIVIDLRLPRLGGGPLASWLAHHPRYACIPVVGVGVGGDLAAGAELATWNVADDLTSVVDDDALVATVDRYCLG
jgi:hypothetical protein